MTTLVINSSADHADQSTFAASPKALRELSCRSRCVRFLRIRIRGRCCSSIAGRYFCLGVPWDTSVRESSPRAEWSRFLLLCHSSKRGVLLSRSHRARWQLQVHCGLCSSREIFRRSPDAVTVYSGPAVVLRMVSFSMESLTRETEVWNDGSFNAESPLKVVSRGPGATGREMS